MKLDDTPSSISMDGQAFSLRWKWMPQFLANPSRLSRTAYKAFTSSSSVIGVEEEIIQERKTKICKGVNPYLVETECIAWKSCILQAECITVINGLTVLVCTIALINFSRPALMAV